MSFAAQALTTEYALNIKGKCMSKVYPVPAHIDDEVARLKLASMEIAIDTLTPEQEEYLRSWQIGT